MCPWSSFFLHIISSALRLHAGHFDWVPLVGLVRELFLCVSSFLCFVFLPIFSIFFLVIEVACRLFWYGCLTSLLKYISAGSVLHPSFACRLFWLWLHSLVEGVRPHKWGGKSSSPHLTGSSRKIKGLHKKSSFSTFRRSVSSWPHTLALFT